MIDRNHIRTCSIIHLHNYYILPVRFQSGTYFADKSTISPFVRAYQTTINIDLRTTAYTFKLQENTFTFPFSGQTVFFPVIRLTCVIITFYHLHITGIVSMWQSHFLPVAVPTVDIGNHIHRKRTFHKLPVVIETADISCCHHGCQTQHPHYYQVKFHSHGMITTYLNIGVSLSLTTCVPMLFSSKITI